MCTYCDRGCTKCNQRGHVPNGLVSPCERCHALMTARQGYPPTYDPESDPMAEPLEEER